MTGIRPPPNGRHRRADPVHGPTMPLEPTRPAMSRSHVATAVVTAVVASYTTVNDRTVSIGAFGMVFVIQPSKE